MNKKEYNPGKNDPGRDRREKTGSHNLKPIMSDNTESDTQNKSEDILWNSMIHSDGRLRPEA